MGDLEINRKGVVQGLEEILARYGIGYPSHGKSPAAGAAPFRRVFVQKGTGASGGEGSSMNCLWDFMDRSAPGQRIDAGGPAFTLTLDPEYTAPGAAIAVHFGDKANAVILRPGQTIDVPAGFDHFFAWNAMGFVRDRFAKTASTAWSYLSAPYGFVAFVVGKQLGARPTAPGASSRPSVAVLSQFRGQYVDAAGGMTDPNVGPVVGNILPYVCTSGLKGIRISAWGVDVNNNRAGALTAVVLRPWVFVPQVSPSALDPEWQGASLTGSWCPCGEDDLTGDANQSTWNRNIPAGAMALILELVSWTAAGALDLLITVEGA